MHKTLGVLIGLTLSLAAILTACQGADPQATVTQTGNRSGAVTVNRVVDGDTIEVRQADGSSATVRVIGVNTPVIFRIAPSGSVE